MCQFFGRKADAPYTEDTRFAFRENSMSNVETATDVSQDMLDLIRREFSEVLGDHVHLLDKPGGLDEILALLKTGQLSGTMERESHDSSQLKRRLSA